MKGGRRKAIANKVGTRETGGRKIEAVKALRRTKRERKS